MLPGTYIPTDPRELEAFALHEASQKISHLSPAIHAAESAYRRIGLKYYDLPSTSSRQNDQACQEAFHVTPTHTPSIIHRITNLRHLTSTIKTQIRLNQGLSAKSNLEFATQELENLHGNIEVLGEKVGSYSNNNNNIEDEVDDAAAERERAWILALPENKRAIDLGFRAEDDVYWETLQTRFVSEDGPRTTRRRVGFEERADDQVRFEDAGYVRFEDAGYVAPPPSLDEEFG